MGDILGSGYLTTGTKCSMTSLVVNKFSDIIEKIIPVL